MTTKSKILIVEDEENLGQTLKEYLEDMGHDVRLAASVAHAEIEFHSFHPHIVLMDVGLPDGDGITLARKLREKNKKLLLLFLSALNDPETKVEALELGANDYITKPFHLKELSFRLQKILEYKKESANLPDEIQIGNLTIWFSRYELKCADNSILTLSQKECQILELLYKNANKAIDREVMIDKIWGKDKFPSNRTIDNYIVKLRKWSESDAKSLIEIQSVRSIGYKLIIKEK